MYYYNNKKTYSKKYKRINPWLFSISVSLIMYVALYFLFGTSTIKVSKYKKNTPQIIMLPLNDSKSNKKQKQLLYWLKDDNPTLIVQPNTTYGYSSILKPDYSFPTTNAIPNINLELNSNTIYVPNFTQLFKIEAYTPLQLLSKLDLINTPDIPPYPFRLPETEKTTYPDVKSYYTGKTVDVKFNNIDKIDKLVNKYNPQLPTVLKVTLPVSPQFFPIVNIISSCGSEELDNIAVKALTMTDMDNFTFGKRNSITTKVYVKWH